MLAQDGCAGAPALSPERRASARTRPCGPARGGDGSSNEDSHFLRLTA